MEPVRVWVTKPRAETESAVYHESPRCPTLRDARSAVLGKELSSLPGKRRCTQCWPSISGFDLVAHDTERDGDSPFEVEFVQRVLTRVRGLSPHDVVPQKELRLNDGTRVRVDFLVSRGPRTPLVIELDGYDKTAGRVPPSEIHQADKHRRRQIEQDLGFEVVDFANIDLASPHEAVRDLEKRVSQQPAAATEGSSDRPEAAMRRKLWVAGVVAVALAALAGGVFWLGFDDSSFEPLGDGSCPAEASVKGNVSLSGEKIFHEPGWRYYSATDAEQCFANVADAEAEGYRASQIE